MRPTSSWALDQRSFGQLLEFLGRDGEAPGEAYERLRDRLESFFRWRGISAPQERADETLDRVAKKLASGEVIETSPSRFALGVARFVALEASRKDRREEPEVEVAEPAPEAAVEDPRLPAIQICLGRLSAGDQSLLLRYHEESQGQARISLRENIARELGIELNALRVRVFRIRAKLERCLAKNPT
ncbi:MAG: hypothetical protein U1E65_34535 [Myxococcota bacterium]